MPEQTVVSLEEPYAVAGSYQPVTSVGALLIDALAPWMTRDLAFYCDALGVMLSPLHDLVADVGFDGDPGYVPGYGSLLNPETCPDEDLPYLAMFAGVQIPAGLGADQARALIINEPARKRGGPDAIVAAAKRFLTGTQSVTLIERQGPNGPDAYWNQLLVRPEELSSGVTWQQENWSWAGTSGTWSSGDQTAGLIAAVNAAKPGGVSIQIIRTDGFTWSSATSEWMADTFSWSESETQRP